MNRNLSPVEFSEQLELFDPVTSGYAQHGPSQPVQLPTPADYPDPHEGERLTISETENPLYSDTAGEGQDLSRMNVAEQGWVPTFGVSSVQTHVNPSAVEHLTRHGTGLAEGEVIAVKGAGEHVIYDGNHRMNAAQRRGQLFIPGEVYDVD